MRHKVLKLNELVFALFAGLPHKHSSSEDYYADDYPDYSSDIEDGQDYLNENEQVVHTVPAFVTEPIDETVNEGDTIKLPCFVEKLGKTELAFLASATFRNLLEKENQPTHLPNDLLYPESTSRFWTVYAWVCCWSTG